MLVGYSHCSFCGSSAIAWKEHNAFICADCQKTNYINYSCAAGCYFYNDKQQVLLAQRARNPRKGKYDDPGGFMDLSDQTAEDTVVREVQEELGIDIIKSDLTYVSSGTLLYHYQERDVPVVALVFCLYLSLDQINQIVPSDDVASIKRVDRDTFNPDDMCTPRQAEQVKMVFDMIS